MNKIAGLSTNHFFSKININKKLGSARNEKKREYIYYIFTFLIIFLFNIRNIRILTAPNIIFDEFGYLATGALFSGKDWSDIVSNFVSYYSYGYGLIIALVLKCTTNTMLAYQILIICNAIMVCIFFIFSEYICSSFISDKRVRLLICFGLCFYPGIIHNTQFVWTEIPLTFLFWLILALFKSLVVKPNVFKSGLFGFISLYLYTVHQRSLGVLFVAFFMMILMASIKIIDKKCFLVFLIMIIIMFAAHYKVKEYVQNTLWRTDGLSALDVDTQSDEINDAVLDNLKVNDYSGQIGKITYIFSREGFKCFSMGILGKIFYFGISSFFLGFEGIYYLAKASIVSFAKYKGKKISDDKFYIPLFVLLSFFATLLISAIFHIYPVRIDTVLYGRYTDWVIPFLIIMGAYGIYSEGMNVKRFLLYIGSALVFLCRFNLFMNEYDLWSNFATCSPITFIFRNDMCNCEVKWVSVMFLIMINFSIFVWIILSRKKKIICLAVGIFIMISVWIGITTPAINYDIAIQNREVLMSILDAINEESNDKTIYYVNKDPDSTDSILYIGCVQYLLGSRSIQVIQPEQLISINEGIIIFNYGSTSMDLLNEAFVNIESNQLCNIYCY